MDKDEYQIWDKIADLYEAKFMDLNLYNATYDFFSELIKQKEATILEVGCGPGNITKYLTTKNPNLTFTATDISVEMIKLAKKNNPQVEFKTLDCRKIISLNRKFDGIISGFTFPYLNLTECEQFFKDSKQLLLPEGVLYFSFIPSEFEKVVRQTNSVGLSLDVYYHNAQELIDLLEKSFFSVIKIFEIDYSRSSNESEKHTIIIARS